MISASLSGLNVFLQLLHLHMRCASLKWSSPAQLRIPHSSCTLKAVLEGVIFDRSIVFVERCDDRGARHTKVDTRGRI